MANSDPRISYRFRKGRTLPLRKGPVRFAVVMANGLTSYSWKVFTKGGDAYVVCRENMKDIKVSLHASGRQHIAFIQGSGHEMTPGSRFWNRWWEPSSKERPPVPSVKLLFPSWATTVALNANRSRWKDNDILIEGDNKLVTSVCLFVMDYGQSLRQTGLPSLTLGVLPVRAGKELHVIACREHPRNLRQVAEASIQFMNRQMPFSKDMVGEVLTALLAGDDPSGCPYILPILVDAKMRITISSQGAMAYDLCMRALVDAGWYTDPASWDSLPSDVQDAWKVIGADWLRQIPTSSRLGKLMSQGSVEVER